MKLTASFDVEDPAAPTQLRLLSQLVETFQRRSFELTGRKPELVEVRRPPPSVVEAPSYFDVPRQTDARLAGQEHRPLSLVPPTSEQAREALQKSGDFQVTP